MRILLVEDETRMAQAIRRGLREAAYAVDVARDGEDARSQAAINDYDAVILVQRLSISCVRGRAPRGCRKPCPKERGCICLDAPAIGIEESRSARRGRLHSRS
jgi:hypothetical protein